LRIPLPAVEVGIDHRLPLAGSITSQLKVLEQQPSQRSLRLRLSAPAASHQSLFLRLNDPKAHLHIEGGEASPDSTHLEVKFPAGTGYVEKVVSISW
jgi:hypothetical protein